MNKLSLKSTPFQQCTRTFATFATRNKSREEKKATHGLRDIYGVKVFIFVWLWGECFWRKLDLATYTWKLLLAILKIVDERKLYGVKWKNENRERLMGLVFTFFLQWSETSTHARINFKRKENKRTKYQTNKSIGVIVDLYYRISSTVNDMKRVERKIAEVKTKTIDLTVTQKKNMPCAIDIAANSNQI